MKAFITILEAVYQAQPLICLHQGMSTSTSYCETSKAMDFQCVSASVVNSPSLFLHLLADTSELTSTAQASLTLHGPSGPKFLLALSSLPPVREVLLSSLERLKGLIYLKVA